MSLELDWLEREERYRQRVTRLLTVFVILVGALVGTGAYLRSKHMKEAREATAKAAEQQRLDAERRQREQFSADSTAVANRWANFLQTYQAKPIEGLPFIELPLPPGQSARSFVERVWPEYVRVIDPAATSNQEITLYRQHFIGVLNDGPMRGRAVLLPLLDQSGTRLEMRKSSFTQITKGQVEVGMREPPEEAPADSLGLLPPAGASGEGAVPTASDASPPATGTTSGAASAAPESAPPAQPAPAPSEPAPATTPPSPPPAPTEPAPATPPPAPSEPAAAPAQPAPADTGTPAPAPAPSDTVPKP